ncbi:thioredoxin family protein [Maribellus luteus]|uniref:Thioredoxin family protein n=1 Tax=Maribellus luteus TaxID=2305463 RepID=A0A399T1M9_9BACT|nr:thioredoxin family protein [Maribellus luteus]RIJ47833.1 thioredoxin family protein [Maribellus luteus]
MHFKKNEVLIGILFVLFTLTLSAQEKTSDFDKIKAKAAAENKNILLIFQGSDWCAPCMKLEKEIWSSDEFKLYAADHWVVYKADFPRKKQNQPDSEQLTFNKHLAEKYNPKGFFPFVAMLDKNGKVLGETGYKKLSPGEYLEHLESISKK